MEEQLEPISIVSGREDELSLTASAKIKPGDLRKLASERLQAEL